jgi:hypothetical protein
MTVPVSAGTQSGVDLQCASPSFPGFASGPPYYLLADASTLLRPWEQLRAWNFGA